MRLSTKGRFAVTAMIDVALRENSGPVPLSDIGVRHQISMSYLEQIFSKLRQHGLVQSTRGPGGGYALGQRAEGITVADIILAVEDAPVHGGLSSTRPGETPARVQAPDMTQDLWDALNSKMVDYMQSITLRSLAVAQRAKGVLVEETPAVNRGVYKQPKRDTLRGTAPNSVFALGQSLLARG
jgi:Rrf2 family iron-sulfur cluster assembly transcriptional regulator